jgi:hypothetical protein
MFGVPLRFYGAAACLTLMPGCCSVFHYQCLPPQTKPEATSQVELRRPVIPADACVAYLKVIWTPISLIGGQPGYTAPIRVPPDQPVRLQGSSGVINGQSVCDYVVDANPNPAPGKWQVTISGIAITSLNCDVDIAAAAKNFHAFRVNTQGCSTTTTMLDWGLL